MGVFRAIISFALAALTAVVVRIGPAVSEDVPVKIIDIGDSLIVGVNLHGSEKFPAALQKALKSRGHLVEVIDTGYKVTSASGLKWLLEPVGRKLLASPASHAVILELGSNDCTYFDVYTTRSNLDQIISQLTKQHIPVLLVGTEPDAQCAQLQGNDYLIAYRQIFPELAKQYGTVFYRDFMDGVSGHHELLQVDDDHPNAAGEAIIVEKILPSVEAAIAKVTQK